MAKKLNKRLKKAVASIHNQCGASAEVGLILGSGLGDIANRIEIAATLPYGEIEEFPDSTAPGHRGNLIFGRWHQRPVAVMQGRFHLYEGWSASDVMLPVYLLQRLGVRTLVITNAAGALNPDFAPGDLMMIMDHINFTGIDPLAGVHDPALGCQFPDMSRAYSPPLEEMARKAALEAGLELREGIYAGVCGPTLETSAERRFFRQSGADAVGMSTVVEVIAAVHCGMSVLGLSAISNRATGGPDQQPDTIEQVLEYAAIAGKKIGRLLDRLIPVLPAN